MTPKRWFESRSFTTSENTGTMNSGIATVMESGTGRIALRKYLSPSSHPNYPLDSEATTLAKLCGHAHIVQIYDFIPAAVSDSGGKDELYLEYCKMLLRGREINTLLQIREAYARARGPVPEMFAWHVLEGLVRAVAFMHLGARDVSDELDGGWDAVLHNDLHVGNVFVSSKGAAGGGRAIDLKSAYPRIVVGDFGAAKMASAVVGRESIPRVTRDVEAVCNILRHFCQRAVVGMPEPDLGDQGSWVFSEELREAVLRLKRLEDGSRSIPCFLKDLIETKEKLVVEGKLEFKPLLQ